MMFRCRFAWQAQGIRPKVSKTWGLRGISRNDRRRVTFEEDRVAGAIQETYSSEMLGGQSADFLRGVAFWSIRSSDLLKWFCVTVQCFVWPGITFSWQAQYFRDMDWKIAKHIGTRPSALHSTFHYWRTSRRIASFLMLPDSKIGILAELLRFWCCQFQKLRNSRRIASFLMLPVSKTEEVSQSCRVFDVVKFNKWGSRRLASFSSLQINR